ncbi:MAG: thioesterase family protein [Candidatus Omnitrophica bacterium]|nr:thioesterase family protein [Candidatus Omnitrophota bacterium]MDD5653683.1 thioesterase family protein [Candidatus Omnitrophota bacterium]
MKKRIYYHDTDCGGVVYYSNYLKYMEEARTEFLEEKGIFILELAKQGVLFVVAHQEIDYKCPAFYGDVLDVETKLEKTGAVKLEFLHEVKNQKGTLICVGKAILVCVGTDIRPRPISEEIRKKLG